MDEDLKALMLHCLEVEKKAVCEDLDDYYCAVVIVITPKGRYYEFPEFSDEDTKIAAYSEVVRNARIKQATAMITINAARTAKSDGFYDLDGYWWGKLAAEDARNCISMTVSGPGMSSLGLDLGYDIVDGVVTFDEIPEFESTEIGMLPGWPDDLPTQPN